LAPISAVYTLAYVAKALGEEADWLWEISCGMEAEEGCLWVYDAAAEPLLVFTDYGIKHLAELVRENKIEQQLTPRPTTHH
jgi:hypothetical protein